MSKVDIINSGAAEALRNMPDESVDCIVTSPPYFGLRNYGVDGQIGLEQSPEDYVVKLLEIFSEGKRVLKKAGTLWLNLGDSYSKSKGKSGYTNDRNDVGWHNANSRRPPPGFKHKELLGIPWRVAFALQKDGWFLRQDIIWNKPNPMPESVKDRCTKAHEYIFLFSRSPRYFFDAKAISEPLAYSSRPRILQDLASQQGSDRCPGKTNGRMKAVYTKPYEGFDTKDYASGGAQSASDTKRRIVEKILSGELVTRNKRSVWTVTTKPYKGAHFATFPRDIVEPCIKAGCPVGGTVLDPFAGSGTTGEVALTLQRNAILIELNPQYIPLIEARLAKVKCTQN